MANRYQKQIEQQKNHIHYIQGTQKMWRSVEFDKEDFYKYLDNPEMYKENNPKTRFLILDGLDGSNYFHQHLKNKPHDSHWKEIAVGNKNTLNYDERFIWRDKNDTSYKEIQNTDLIQRPPMVLGRHNVQVLKLTDMMISREEFLAKQQQNGGKNSRKVSKKSKKKLNKKKKPTKKNNKKRTRKH